MPWTRLCCLAMMVSMPVPAAAGAFEELPTHWRLSGYTSGEVTIFYSSSPCANGMLRLLPSDSDAVKDRFASFVLTAKAMHRKIGVFFDEADGCRISSFYLKEGE